LSIGLSSILAKGFSVRPRDFRTNGHARAVSGESASIRLFFCGMHLSICAARIGTRSLSMLSRSGALCAACFVGPSILASQFASSVVSYDKGTYAGGYSTAASALGSPDATTGTDFPNILSPFSPAYNSNQLAGIGQGGQITLSFPQPVSVISGLEIGVIGNIGLADASYPSGQNLNPALTFNDLPRIADVEVSFDGTDYRGVGRVNFANPANYFLNAADPYLTAPPASPVMADFGKPFAGTLATFNGLNWSQTLAALDGSGGGTWIDASSSGLSSFQFVRFSIPAAGITGSDNQLFIDAVSVNNAAIPEPAVLGSLLPLATVLRRKSR
jgi:hypothetical protein